MPNVNESASEYAANCALGNESRGDSTEVPPSLDENARMQEPLNHAA